jgi:hypothetical protein
MRMDGLKWLGMAMYQNKQDLWDMKSGNHDNEAKRHGCLSDTHVGV